MLKKRKRRRPWSDAMMAAASRGLLQAMDTHGYEQAYEALQRDPEVQRALDDLIEKLVLSFQKHRKRSRTSA